MRTQCSSPDKVGLIDVGTKFARSRLAWPGVAYGNYDFYGNVVFEKWFVANANLVPNQSAQVIVQRGTRYVESFSLLAD